MNEFSARLSWSDFVYELADLLRKIEHDAQLFLVGGAVRDAYLRGAIGDIDIAVDGDAIALARSVADALDADIYVMDHERAVARVFIKNEGQTLSVDFAGLRGATLESDLRDRDFTMNAMAADMLGDLDTLIDPLGGAADLRQKVLRRCSPRSITDDPIRLLRAVRLSVQFDLKIHPDTACDIRQFSGELRKSSPERIRDEFFKLLSLVRAARGLRVLQHLGALRHVAPEIGDLMVLSGVAPQRVDDWSRILAVVERMSAILTAISSRRTDNTAASFDLGTLTIQFDRFRASLQEHLDQVYGNGRRRGELLILAALLSNIGGSSEVEADATNESKRAAAAADSLKLTQDERRSLATIVGNYRMVAEKALWTTLDQHRFWFRLGAEGIDVIMLGVADVLGTHRRAFSQYDWLQLVDQVTNLLDTYFNRYDELVNPKLFLNGNEVLDLLRIMPGPQVGHVLTAMREAQVTGEISSVQEARQFVRRTAVNPG